MRKNWYLPVLSPIFCALLFAFAVKKGTGDLALRFQGITSRGGTVRLALYSSEAAFMDEKKATLYNFPAGKPGVLEANIPQLPQGTYAFAVFLDENNNRKLDKNLFGVPIEPYGFSKQPPSKWRLPTFNEVKFVLDGPSRQVEVKLERWAL